MPRKDLESYPKKVGYRKHPGMLAWLAHRVTGVYIGLFLILHLMGVGGIFEGAGTVTGNSVIKAIFILFFSFHAFNGIRIVFMEFGSGSDRETFSKYVMAAVFVTLIISVIGFIRIFSA